MSRRGRPYLFVKETAKEVPPVRQATALGLKFLMYLVIFGVSMPVFGLMALPQSIILAAVHTLLLWFADLIILPRFGNTVATFGDAITLLLGSFFVLFGMMAVPRSLGLMIAVGAGTIFEWFFHKWLFTTGVLDC
jgi:hypothetical protein